MGAGQYILHETLAPQYTTLTGKVTHSQRSFVGGI